MGDYDEFGNYGDPETDPDAAALDHQLRELLTDLPHPGDFGSALPPEVAEEISRAVSWAWPDGHPPTADELAREDAGHDPYDHVSVLEPHSFEAEHGHGGHGADHTDVGHETGHGLDHGQHGDDFA